MTVYKKLAEARVKLQEAGLKKSGKNKFAGYEYFELEDFLPAINKINNELGLCAVVSFTQDMATLKVVNVEKTDEVIEISSPMKEATLKGCHDIQNLGAVESYQRRYLYMAAYEIAESDILDSTTGKENPTTPSTTKKLTDGQIKRLYAIANNAGYGADIVKKQMAAKYNVTSAEKLTREQYDELCNGYEKLTKN